MSEHQLPQKTIALVANSTVSLTWGAVEFGQAFSESIVKKQVAMRLSCSTTATQAVFIAVRYETATKSYRIAEAPTIGQIPASGSVEITPASVGALGLLNEWIISITVELTTQSATGTATVSLILDDEPPPLSNLPDQTLGLNAAIAQDNLIISNFGSANIAGSGGTSTNTWYQVPAGKRFYIDTLCVNIGPTGSYPADMEVIVAIDVNGSPTNIILFSESDRFAQTFIPPISMALVGGDRIRTIATNNSGSTVAFYFTLLGRELF